MVSIRIDFSKSKQGHLTYAVKTFSVQRSKTVLYDCCTMFCSRVAHIFVPIIQRVRLVSFNHEIIPIRLGKNCSSGYALKFSVSFDNTFKRNIQVGVKPIAVNEQKVGTKRQFADSIAHCKKGSLENVYFVYGIVIHKCHCIAQCIAFDNRTQPSASFVAQLLRIVQLLAGKISWQNNSGSNNRTCQTASSCLVAAAFHNIFLRKITSEQNLYLPIDAMRLSNKILPSVFPNSSSEHLSG